VPFLSPDGPKGMSSIAPQAPKLRFRRG
jgi:hypothetical protein